MKHPKYMPGWDRTILVLSLIGTLLGLLMLLLDAYMFITLLFSLLTCLFTWTPLSQAPLHIYNPLGILFILVVGWGLVEACWYSVIKCSKEIVEAHPDNPTEFEE